MKNIPLNFLQKKKNLFQFWVKTSSLYLPPPHPHTLLYFSLNKCLRTQYNCIVSLLCYTIYLIPLTMLWYHAFFCRESYSAEAWEGQRKNSWLKTRNALGRWRTPCFRENMESPNKSHGISYTKTPKLWCTPGLSCSFTCKASLFWDKESSSVTTRPTLSHL